MDPTTITEAARARGEALAARADRPTQRRCARDQSSGAWVPARAKEMSIREADDSGLLAFEGYATVYEQGYEMYDFWGPYTEVVSQGAGAKSLQRADLDVPLVLQHQSLRRIARTTNGTLELAEDEHGLRVVAPSLDPNDHDVAYVAPKLRAGLLDEMSFMFRIVRGQWSPDYTEFRIEEYDLHRGDVAIVGYGANPFTAGSGLRANPFAADLDPAELLRSLDDADVLRVLAEVEPGVLARGFDDDVARRLLAELQGRYQPPVTVEELTAQAARADATIPARTVRRFEEEALLPLA